MATGWSTASANAILDAAFRNVPFSYGAAWLKLHTGDPGVAGTSNPAAETTRKQITSAAASGAENTSTTLLSWTNVPANETFSHVSVWTLSAAGVFICSASLVAPVAVTIGQTFELAIGDIDFLIPVAS